MCKSYKIFRIINENYSKNIISLGLLTMMLMYNH